MKKRVVYFFAMFAITFLFAGKLSAQTDYYLSAGGDPTVLTDWGTSTNGSGANPASFTAGDRWNFNNNNSSVTINGTWYLGSGSEIIAGDGANALTLTISGAVTTGTFLIQQSATVMLPANIELMIAGDLVNNGSISSNSPHLTILGFNGSVSNNQDINGNAFIVGSIRAYSGSRTINVNTQIDLWDSLKVGNSVNFASNGAANLTLKANATLKARIASINSGGQVSGNVTVETFIPGGTTGWANLGVNGVRNQTVSDWDTYFTSGMTNGIPMTCTGCVYTQSAAAAWFNSITGWSEPAHDYDTLVSAATALTPGKGFWVYVGNGFATTTDLKLVNTGPVVQGFVNFPLTSTTGSNKGFNLVSNPFPSPISWESVLAISGGIGSGLSDAIYVWNADIGTTTSYVNGVKSHGSGIGDVIPAGQGFYVETSVQKNIIFVEDQKVNGNTGSNPLLRTTAEAKKIGQVFHLKLTGQVDWDETAFRVHPEASPAFDNSWDAHKIFQSPGYAGYPGPYNKYTTISTKDDQNEDYSIQSIPTLTTSVTIPLLVRVSTSGTYTIDAVGADNLNDCVLLRDKLLDATQDLKAGSYIFKISDTTAAARFELILCRDRTANLVSVNELEQSGTITISQDQQGAFVKTIFDDNTKATISVFNVIGQKLMEDVKVEGKVTETRLNLNVHNQVVLVKVVTDKGSSTKKIVIH